MRWIENEPKYWERGEKVIERFYANWTVKIGEECRKKEQVTIEKEAQYDAEGGFYWEYLRFVDNPTLEEQQKIKHTTQSPSVIGILNVLLSRSMFMLVLGLAIIINLIYVLCHKAT